MALSCYNYSVINYNVIKKGRPTQSHQTLSEYRRRGTQPRFRRELIPERERIEEPLHSTHRHALVHESVFELVLIVNEVIVIGTPKAHVHERSTVTTLEVDLSLCSNPSPRPSEFCPVIHSLRSCSSSSVSGPAVCTVMHP